MLTKEELQKITCNGFHWVFNDDDGAYIFVKKTQDGYKTMRLLSTDMTNGNFEYMANHELTNTNPVVSLEEEDEL